MQQLFPVFITTKTNLIGYIMLRGFNPTLARGVSEILAIPLLFMIKASISLL